MKWPRFLAIQDESGRAVRVRWRYLLLIAAALVVIGVAAVYLPVAMTSTPSFCQNCHLMKEPTALWEESTHANVNCVQCHVEPGILKTLEHKALSYKEIYFNFFGEGRMPEDIALPTNAACLQCHNLDRTVSPGGDIKIPHREHVEMRNLKCADCHFNVVHTRRGTPGGAPPMDICYMCHDGKRAPNACDTCHTTPVKDLQKQGHPTDALQNHGKLAQDRSEDCKRCHSDRSRFCENCHNKPPASHKAATWRYTHKTVVETSGRATCEGCHKPEFCQKCHKVQHPPNWKQVHKEFAQGGGDACQVCHSPNFCQDCHKASGVTTK